MPKLPLSKPNEILYDFFWVADNKAAPTELQASTNIQPASLLSRQGSVSVLASNESLR